MLVLTKDRNGKTWRVDVERERVGGACSTLWSYQKIDGRWRSFDGTGFGLSVRTGVKILLDSVLASARGTR